MLPVLTVLLIFSCPYPVSIGETNPIGLSRPMAIKTIHRLSVIYLALSLNASPPGLANPILRCVSPAALVTSPKVSTNTAGRTRFARHSLRRFLSHSLPASVSHLSNTSSQREAALLKSPFDSSSSAVLSLIISATFKLSQHLSGFLLLFGSHLALWLPLDVIA